MSLMHLDCPTLNRQSYTWLSHSTLGQANGRRNFPPPCPETGVYCRHRTFAELDVRLIVLLSILGRRRFRCAFVSQVCGSELLDRARVEICRFQPSWPRKTPVRRTRMCQGTRVQVERRYHCPCRPRLAQGAYQTKPAQPECRYTGQDQPFHRCRHHFLTSFLENWNGLAALP